MMTLKSGMQFRSAVLGLLVLLAAPPLAQGQAVATACSGMEITARGSVQCLPPLSSFKDCDTCPEMIVVPRGSFEMGSPEDEIGRSDAEGPRHTVSIAKPFLAGKFEVTFAEWDQCVADGGCTHVPRDSGWGRGRRPVINVSWEDATGQFLPWLSKKAGRVYRLLTEAEWEYAARAGSPAPFSGGTVLTTDEANFDGTSTYTGSPKGEYRKRTLEAGSFKPNAFGLHDMNGNVWEWVQDCFTGTYAGAPQDGSAIPDVPGCSRGMRGGSWIDSPRVLRSAARGSVPPSTRFIYRGFRVAASD